MSENIIPDAKTISIILPTRKRPEWLSRLIVSIIETSQNTRDIEICARVDYDDIETIETLHSFSNQIDIKISIGTRQTCHGYYWNDAWNLATGDVLQMSSDDFVYHTQGWDVEILKAINKYEDKMAFVFGSDGIQEGFIGTHFFIHKRWAEKLGYFVTMKTNVFYHDTWNDEIAKLIGRKVYLPELYFEHKHWSTHPGTRDQVHDEARQNCKDEDSIWHSTAGVRQEEADKLKELLHVE